MAVKIQARGKPDCHRNLWDDGAYSDIQRILINHDSKGVYNVQIEYIDENGKPIWGSEHSDVTLRSPSKVELDYPNEYLTSIHGYYYEKSFEFSRITSLTFKSNKKTWGPYGKKEGTKFSFPIMSAKIVGFHGCSTGMLEAIGVYVTPITKSKALLKSPVVSPQLEHFNLGLYGREDGEYWSEKFVAIKRFVIHHDDDWIVSIQIEYVDENGKSVWSKKHGGDGGTPKQVDLEHPDEQLVTIMGYYDNSFDSKSSTNVIRSLTVITNKKLHEAVGVKKGTHFKFPGDGRLKVVGIHGRSDLYLNAIGIYAALI